MPERSAPSPSRGAFVAGGIAALACAPHAARAQAPSLLRANIFGGLDAWPLYVMHDRGFLARNGVDLELTTTAGSVAQFQHLTAGDAGIAATAFDNVVAYDAGQGDPSVTGADFVAFFGIGSGFLKLIARPEITSYNQFRGKAFAVDAPGTGFSFVLRRMLEKNGVLPGEYSFVALGNTQKRFAGIASGQCAGGMVGAPFDVLGRQQFGLNVFGSALDVLGHYQATVVAARRSWLAANRPAARALVRAYRATAQWMFDPANRDAALTILARNTDLPPALIAQAGPAVLADPHSFSHTGAFDPAGVATTMELRAAYAVPAKPLADAKQFIDDGYL